MCQVQACKEPWVQLHPRPEQLLRRLLGGGGPAHDRRRQHGVRHHHPDQPQVGAETQPTGGTADCFLPIFVGICPIFTLIMIIFQKQNFHSMPPVPPLLCRLWSSIDQGGNIKSIICYYAFYSFIILLLSQVRGHGTYF